MLAYEMNKLAYSALTVNDFIEKLDKTIRERAEQGRFMVSVQVPRDIVGKVRENYYQQGFNTLVLNKCLDTKNVVLHLNWL